MWRCFIKNYPKTIKTYIDRDSSKTIKTYHDLREWAGINSSVSLRCPRVALMQSHLTFFSTGWQHVMSPIEIEMVFWLDIHFSENLYIYIYIHMFGHIDSYFGVPEKPVRPVRSVLRRKVQSFSGRLCFSAEVHARNVAWLGLMRFFVSMQDIYHINDTPIWRIWGYFFHDKATIFGVSSASYPHMDL